MNKDEMLSKMEKIIKGVDSVCDYSYKHDLLIKSHDAFFIKNLKMGYEECHHYYKKSKELDDMQHGFIDIKEFKDRFKREYFLNRKDYVEFLGILFEEWNVEIFDELGINEKHKALTDISDIKSLFKDWDFSLRSLVEIQSEEELLLFLDGCYQEDLDMYNIVEDKLNKIYDFLKENGVLEISFAEQFVENTFGEDLLDFINKKQFNDKISYELEMTKSQDFQKVVFFSDDSIAMQTRKGDWTSPKFKSGVYSEIMKDIAHQYVDYTFRKKPKYKEIFKEKLQNDGYKLMNFEITSQNLIQYENTLKAHDKDFFDKIKSKDMKLESVDDFINKVIYESKVKKFAMSIISKKYSHLYNEESLGYFKELYDLNISHSSLESNIGSKMAGFKTSEDLNAALRRFYNSLNDFDKESYLLKSENANTDVVLDGRDLLILKINDYKASSILGSASWCISRNENYFKNYTENDNSQYFIYDFSKDSSDNDSMIGITLDKKGEKTAMHYKNDDNVFQPDVVNKWKTIINDEFKKKNDKKQKMKMV